MRDDQLVRRWITESLPGSFDADTPEGAVAAAFEESGLSEHMTLAVFRGSLHLVGYMPQCVRAGLYRLNLPDGKSPGVKARAYRV